MVREVHWQKPFLFACVPSLPRAEIYVVRKGTSLVSLELLVDLSYLFM